ncbi:hypothetical protein GCM10010123_14560 [Pilimelia anulata]|uniref:Uncharacterized protein n=1 Tax=Pilimelia anulata TaxID=53371 RepID=A0A8J3B5X8_9ACTN|nr:hypothetical protein [Pilimelia anulata]GGJ86047.1 hypothetical protein GCM10010123_14560 [Pilimelia anulata]
MPTDARFLSTRQRRWAWVGFVLLSLHAPVVARLLPDASWLLSICVAGLLAVVLLADDEAGRAARRMAADEAARTAKETS